MADKLDILVHVGAPSTARDDARYRTLVEASLAFETVSRCSIIGINEDINKAGLPTSVDGSPSTPSCFGLQTSLLPQHEKAASFYSGDESCSFVTPNEVEQSRINIKNSILPCLPKDTTAQGPSAYLQFESTEEEDSELSFQPVIPLNSHTHSQIQAQPDFTYQVAPAKDSRQEDGAIVTCLETGRRNSPMLDNQHESISNWATPLDVIPDSQQNEESVAGQTILDDSVQVDRSFVPNSARQSGHLEGDKPWTEDSQLSDITRIPSSVPSPSPVQDQDKPKNPTSMSSASQSLCSKSLGKRKLAENAITETRSGFPTSNTASLPLSVTTTISSSKIPLKKRQTLPQTTEKISLSTLPIEIRAPDPPVSNSQFFTHITPTLQSLAQRMKHASRFKPTRQSRELLPLERGYWFIPRLKIIPDNRTVLSSVHADSETWTITFFSQFWCFMREFLTEGRAGWGIWCLLESRNPRNSDSDNDNINNNGTDIDNDNDNEYTANPRCSGAKYVTFKVYTWGEIAPHIYLLLFLATERGIRKMKGVEWRDARDEGVIVM